MNVAELTESLDRIPRIWRTAKPLSDAEVVEWHRTLAAFPASTLSKVMDRLASESGRDWPPHLPELASRCRTASRSTQEARYGRCSVEDAERLDPDRPEGRRVDTCGGTHALSGGRA